MSDALHIVPLALVADLHQALGHGETVLDALEPRHVRPALLVEDGVVRDDIGDLLAHVAVTHALQSEQRRVGSDAPR